MRTSAQIVTKINRRDEEGEVEEKPRATAEVRWPVGDSLHLVCLPCLISLTRQTALNYVPCYSQCLVLLVVPCVNCNAVSFSYCRVLLVERHRLTVQPTLLIQNI